MKPDEIINAQLAKLLGKYAEGGENQTNVDLLRRIAGLYEQKGELQTALEWYEYTSFLSNHTDPAIAQKATEIDLKILDQSIAEFESWLAQYGNAENAPEVRRHLEDLKGRRLVVSQRVLSQPKATSWATNEIDQAEQPPTYQGRHGPW